MSEWAEISSKKLNLYILINFIIALLLSSIPVDSNYFFWLPEWLGASLIFWAINRPDKVNIGIAMLVGIFIDIINNNTLGIHSLTYSIMIYLVVKNQRKIDGYSYGKQALVVFSLLLLSQFIISLLNVLNSHHFFWLFFISPIITALLWPIFNKLTVTIFNLKFMNR